MTEETRIQLRLLERELGEAIRPLVNAAGHVSGWPRVSHPGVVRRWLGDDAVVALGDARWLPECVGTLADPEACGHVLASVRQLLATGAMLPIDGSDEVVAEYCGRVFARCVG
jgi:hypothetical protein